MIRDSETLLVIVKLNGFSSGSMSGETMPNDTSPPAVPAPPASTRILKVVVPAGASVAVLLAKPVGVPPKTCVSV